MSRAKKERPPCGMAGCEAKATRADVSGVGFCRACGPDVPLVSADNPFDPWWAASSLDPVGFDDLDYGQWPAGRAP